MRYSPYSIHAKKISNKILIPFISSILYHHSPTWHNYTVQQNVFVSLFINPNTVKFFIFIFIFSPFILYLSIIFFKSMSGIIRPISYNSKRNALATDITKLMETSLLISSILYLGYFQKMSLWFKISLSGFFSKNSRLFLNIFFI